MSETTGASGLVEEGNIISNIKLVIFAARARNITHFDILLDMRAHSL